MFTYLTNQSPYTDESTREGSIANMCDNTSLYGTLRKELAMATLINRRGKWYVRIRWCEKYGRNKEKQIPLRTHLKTEAYARLSVVEKMQDDIKSGMEFSFSWQNDKGKTKIVRHILQDTIDEYHAVKNINGLRHSTIERSQCALKTLTALVGKSFPIQSISESHIQEWKEYWVKKHKPNTININLSKIKAFLNWCFKKKYIPEKVDIEMVEANQKPVAYLSDSKLANIMKTDAVENHFKRAFLFYLLTGCRKAEPFQGTLSGEWLIIEPETAKSHCMREVHLTPELFGILHEIRNRHDELIAKYGYKSKNIIGRYSKEFKKACRSVGLEEHHLHNLRDTYAVRRWAVTGDILLVAKEIGHGSVTMTEKYTKFNLRRLIDDFPTLTKYIEQRLERHVQDNYWLKLLKSDSEVKNGFWDTESWDTTVPYSS